MSRNINRSSTWILAAALGIGAFVPWASAKSDTIDLNKVPQPARKQIQETTKGGQQVRIYDLGTVGSHKTSTWRTTRINPGSGWRSRWTKAGPC